ncbi:MAG: cytoplasmic protein [Myxococcota bacterium]|nr:cytoplasmic protein [Myxococcota bacterium]
MSDQPVVGDIEVDIENLYREESFSDMKVASIRRLTPVLTDGSDDTGRPTLFIGETTLMSQRGPLPVQAPIEASTLSEAFEKFPAAINVAVEQLIEQAREMQRQEASRIVVPGGQGAPGGSRIIS